MSEAAPIKSTVPQHRVRRSGQRIRVFTPVAGVEVKFKNAPTAKFFYEFAIREPSDRGEHPQSIVQRALDRMNAEISKQVQAVNADKSEESASDG